VKVFEVEVVHVHEVLMQVARTSSEVCSSDSSHLNNSSSENAVPTVNKKKKAGRPKTTHRKRMRNCLNVCVTIQMAMELKEKNGK
jgi:hypothetical protein